MYQQAGVAGLAVVAESFRAITSCAQGTARAVRVAIPIQSLTEPPDRAALTGGLVTAVFGVLTAHHASVMFRAGSGRPLCPDAVHLRRIFHDDETALAVVYQPDALFAWRHQNYRQAAFITHCCLSTHLRRVGDHRTGRPRQM